jgi:hypothetical protein
VLTGYGPGGTFIVTCPAGTSYSYCLRNQNDGVGNHIELGVVVDTVPPTCTLTRNIAGPLGQIDVTFRDTGSGISVIEMRGGSTNLQLHLADFREDDAPAVMTATKIKQGQPGRLPQILVSDGAGNVRSCSFEF